MGGTPVYRGMTREQLDVQYDARATVDDITPYLDRYAELSAAARDELFVRENLQYGTDQAATLDLFVAGANAPLLIFVHGGYWRLLSSKESAFMAKPFVMNGISVAAVNYPLAPAATLDAIVLEVQRCVAYLWNQADELQLDRSRFTVCGTSAGGHLAAMLLDRRWVDRAGLSDHPIAAACLISGLFDLEPVRLCHPNEWLFLDRKAALRNSPSVHVSHTHPCPTLVCWAGADTDEFKRQSVDYSKQLADAGFVVDAFEVQERNHFDIVLDLACAERPLTGKLMDQIDRL